MPDALSAGAHTDLDLRALQGARIEDRGDHLVIRSPENPDFHWGNYVQVTSGDPAAAKHWLDVFAAALPEADHVAIGLPELPQVDGYAAHGVQLSTDDVLTTTGLPELRELAAGYTARPLASDDDWEQLVAAACADNAVTGDHGAREWVIVTESTNPAGWLYRSLGFVEGRQTVTAYRSEKYSR